MKSKVLILIHILIPYSKYDEFMKKKINKHVIYEKLLLAYTTELEG